MPSTTPPTEMPQTPASASVPAGLHAFLSQGLRKILITRPDEPGLASPAAAIAREPDSRWQPRGFAGAAGLTLAASGRRVVLVQVGAGRPARRGLRDLLHEAYLRDPLLEPGAMLGIGDWLEILNAQQRSGEIELREGGDRVSLQIERGSIRALACPYAPGEERLPESALRARASDRVARLLSARHAQIRFTPDVTPPAPAGAAASHLDSMLRGRLWSPFLDQRIAESLARTAEPNLRVLAAGADEPLTGTLRRPFANLLDRLARDADVVLIDAPPVASVGLTATIAALAEAALVVVHAADVRSPSLLRAVDGLRRAGAATVAVHTVRTPIAVAPAPLH